MPKPVVLLALALAAGYLDAVSYLGLGDVFTANMTGNTVLLAIAAVEGHAADAAHSATALAGFATGVAVGATMIRVDGGWPGRAAAILWVETLLLAALLTVWLLAGIGDARYWLIAAASIAMGAQSVAVRSSHVDGVNTTYMTSTFLNAISRAVLYARGVRESRGGPGLPASTWAIYGVGAVAGALAEGAWRAGSAAVPLAVLGGVALAATLAGKRAATRAS